MSVPQIAAYHRPPDLESAWALLRDGGATVRPLSGGSDLVVRCPPEVRELVDLADTGLAGVTTQDDGRLRLGAMTTFTELLEAPLLATYGAGVVTRMLGQLGSVLHRNSATLGGHVARARMSDVIPVLLAVDASVVTYDGVERETTLATYLAAAPGPHLITAVVLPVLPPRSAAAFERFSRSSFDHALLGSCCRLDLDDDGTISAARVVVGEPAILGRRITAAEVALVGAAPSERAIADAVAATRDTIDCRDDLVASAEYRRHLAGVAVERCLRAITLRLEGGVR